MENPAGNLDAEKKPKESSKESIKEILEQLRTVAYTIGGVGPYRIQVDEKGDRFYFSHTDRSIHFGVEGIAPYGFSIKELQGGFLHETGHLVQLLQDGKSYVDTFETAKRKAQENPHVQQNPKLQKSVEKLWNHFYNALLDCHSNKGIVTARMPTYQEGQIDSDNLISLYRDKLFPATEEKSPIPDYNKRLKSIQFLNWILRSIMVPDENPIVSDEVQKVLETPVEIFGEKMSVLEFTRRYVCSSRFSVDRVIFYFENFLAPIFSQLVERDLEYIEQDKKSGDIPDHLGEIDIDGEQFNPESLKDFLKDINEDQKSLKEKSRDELRKSFESWARSIGISDVQIEHLWKIKERCDKYANELEELWEYFRTYVSDINTERMSGFKTGVNVDVSRITPEYTTLKQNPSQAEIFERYVPTEQLELFPKDIHLILIVDLSGSMDFSKREAVQDVTYSIAQSLMNFKKRQELNRLKDDEEIINIHFYIIGFGGDTRELTSFDKDIENSPEDLVRALFIIRSTNLGGTVDAPSLTQAKEFILGIKQSGKKVSGSCIGIQIPGPVYDEEQLERIKKGEISEDEVIKVSQPSGLFQQVWGEQGEQLNNIAYLKQTMMRLLRIEIEKQTQFDSIDEISESAVFVIEITDGETNSPQESRRAIEEINKLFL